MTTLRLLTLCGCAMAALAVSSGFASAQQANVSVAERSAASNGPQGIRVRAFTLFPQFDLGVTATDNIFASDTNEQSETFAVVTPSVTLQSNWSRHQLRANASITESQFSEFGSEETSNYSFGAGGLLEIGTEAQLEADIRSSGGSEARTQGNTPENLEAPIEYDNLEWRAAASYGLNRRLRARLTYVGLDSDYQDGTLLGAALPGGGIGDIVFDQDNRDLTSNEIEARLDYALSPDTALFGAVAQRVVEYEGEPGQLDRDSDGLQALAGISFDLTKLARGEIGVGYTSTSFDDSLLSDVSGVSISGRVEYFPTQLTTVNLSLVRDIQESGVAEASSVERTSFSAGADHELFRQVILNWAVRYDDDDYNNLDREDQRTGFDAGVTYYPNRIAAVGVRYAFRDQDSSGADRDRNFDANQIALTLTLRR